MLARGPDGGPTLLLAHGAGAPMDSGFMEAIAAALAARDVATLRFEFAYMATRREDGKRRPPDRMPKLEAAFREVFAAARERVGSTPLFIGGKSMGGRVASMLADDLRPAGLVCLGYPFHPPGNPDRLRTEHLRTLKTPTLIVQGERDPFGATAEVPGFELSGRIQVEWAPDGDHDLKPRKKSGRSHDDNIAAAADAIVGFVGEVARWP